MLYYIRVDHGGSFHTYPYAGGPFQSLDEADKAMDRYFLEHRDPKLLMHQGGVSSLEMAIEAALYWPDGARKRSKSDHAERARNGRRRLLQALVDKHNEDHSLLGVCSLLSLSPTCLHSLPHYHDCPMSCTDLSM